MLISEPNVMFILSTSASDTEVHHPVGKVRKLFCKNWFPEFLKIAQFPSPALPRASTPSPSLNISKHLSLPTKQAKDWAGRRILLNLSGNKICNDGLLCEAGTEFRYLVSLEKKSCLACAETNQNRELKIRIVLLIVCNWQKNERIESISEVLRVTHNYIAVILREGQTHLGSSSQFLQLSPVPFNGKAPGSTLACWVIRNMSGFSSAYVYWTARYQIQRCVTTESLCCQGAPVECGNQTLRHYWYYMVCLRGGTLCAAKEGTENFQEIIPEADLARGLDENQGKGLQQTLVHVLWAGEPHAIPMNRIWRIWWG